MKSQKSKVKSQNHNLKFKIFDSRRRRAGFSLIELLIVVSLIGIIGAISTQVFILSVRTRGKGEILKEVKQNGDYAVAVIESLTRNAFDIFAAECNQNTNRVTLLNTDGFTTTFECSSDKISSISGGFPLPTPELSQSLTSSRVAIPDCNFRVVCPTPPLSPKYLFLNFTISQAGVDLPPEQKTSLEYQTTVSLRRYQ